MKFPDISTLYSFFKKSLLITIDSRKASPGAIFFALKGDNFNGNQFASSAIQQGCNYVVIDEEEYYTHEKCILVRDSLTALQELATYHRSKLSIPFIAVTGSNGKTTTKEFIKNVLSKKYKVLATTGNLNNHIGVPLTILQVTSEIEIAIIEMGANHVGEIAHLCEIAKPDYGLITNIGKAHIGEFGSFEAIIKAKTELYQFLKRTGGKVFVNSGNQLLLSASHEIEQITYGSSQKDFCFCQLAETSPFLKINYENEFFASQLIGKYNFENIAAAICIGKYFGVGFGQIKEAIEAYIPSNNRSQILHTKTNTLILDAYNANPNSMRAAIENFYDMEVKNKWLILGDMFELGAFEIQEHKAILEFLEQKNFKNIILVGEVFSKAFLAMRSGSLTPLLFKNSDELASKLKKEPFGKDPATVLIKGSRGIKLEKIVEFL